MADRRLQVFLAVAKHLHFTKASEELNMTQPAVTFQVRSFEDELGFRLFERKPGNVSLTPAGVRVVEFGNAITGLYAQLRQQLVADDAGRVQVYRPVTNIEAAEFKGKFCHRCAKRGSGYFPDNGCDIELRSMVHRADDLNYPVEWRYVTAGDGTAPVCTAFVQKEGEA